MATTISSSIWFQWYAIISTVKTLAPGAFPFNIPTKVFLISSTVGRHLSFAISTSFKVLSNCMFKLGKGGNYRFGAEYCWIVCGGYKGGLIVFFKVDAKYLKNV